MPIPQPATNYCSGNGLIHMYTVGCPNDHKSHLPWSSELHFASKRNSTCYTTECRLYIYQTQQLQHGTAGKMYNITYHLQW